MNPGRRVYMRFKDRNGNPHADLTDELISRTLI